MDTGHFLENILLLPRLMRQAGIPVSPEQSRDFARALTLIDLGSRDQVFHTARSLLVTRKEHLRLFETLFNRFWRSVVRGGQAPRQEERRPRRARREKRIDVVSLMSHKAQPSDPEIEIGDRSGSFSAAEALQRKSFAEMTPEELETVRRLIQEMRWQAARRQTRRRVAASKGGSLDLRRVLRAAVRHNGVPLELFWQARKEKERPLVLIADISGSMEKYARVVLQLFYSVTHSMRDTECFVFGTRLTRITAALQIKNIDRAIDDAARQVVDWSGGTRIGQSLQRFNRCWSRRVLRRGAIVLIVSDGWERGDVTLLQQQMQFLSRRCYRLIWLNPLLGHEAYEPRVEGMAAALPYIDDFLPVHNFHSLLALSQHLGQLRSQRGARAGVTT